MVTVYRWRWLPRGHSIGAVYLERTGSRWAVRVAIGEPGALLSESFQGREVLRLTWKWFQSPQGLQQLLEYLLEQSQQWEFRERLVEHLRSLCHAPARD